jgi:hypothetical protein
MAILLAAGVGNAQAASIVNFEDLALDSMGAGGDRISGALSFDTSWNHSHIDINQWGTSNGTKFMMVDNVATNLGGTSNTNTFSTTWGGPFALTSMDVSEAGNPGTMARQVQVTGNLWVGGIVSTLLVLDSNLVDGVTANYFQTFVFGPEWNNLASVTLSGLGAQCCGPIGGNYYGIDNIVIDFPGSQVPEPATLTLVGLGSAYLVRRRRNRR